MKIKLIIVTAILTIFLGCKSGVSPEDPGPGSHTISSGVSGTITFTGEWPETAAEVKLVTAKVFPPEMSEIIYGASIPVDASTYDYEFDLEPGEYKLLGVAWRNEGADWNVPSICNFYYAKGNYLAPASITVNDNNHVVSGIDINVDRTIARVVSDAKITGKVTFNGTWPEKFNEARVIATTKFDLSTLELPSTSDLTFSKRIENGTSSFDYEIPAYPGKFLATFVVFFEDGKQLSEENVFYSNDHGGLDMATTYNVELGESVKGPDFTIEF